MTKYCGRKVRQCEEWIAEHGLMDYGGAQLQQYVKAMGIDDTTHRLWMRKRPEYVEALERGMETFRIKHSQKLFNTLMEAAEGGFKETEEENSEYRPGADGKPQIVKMLRHKRKTYVKPDTTAAIFLMCNLDPTHWRQRQDNNVAFKKSDSEEEMSLDEIKEELKRLEEE